MAVSSGWAFDLPMTACGDLSALQYCFVRPSGAAKRVYLADGASAPGPIGVLQNDPKSGDEATVRILGTTKVYADGSTAIAYGDWVTAGSDGQAIVTTGSGVHGIAMQALASGASVLIEILLFPYHQNTVDNTP